MFIAALFKVPQTGSNSIQWVNEQTNWYIHTMEHYSSVKKKNTPHTQKTIVLTSIWLNLKAIMLSERSQS